MGPLVSLLQQIHCLRPIIVIPFSAVRDQNNLEAGCSTQLAYVWARVTALPYCLHPLHVPLAFSVVQSFMIFIQTKERTVGAFNLPLFSFLGGGLGMGSPNMFWLVL